MEDNLNISDLIFGEKADTDAIDRLSSLPEHLISDILSKLDTKSAAKTSILSRHWHHQWTYITRFRLSSFNIPNCDELFDFLTTVDNILQKLNSPSSNLRTFYLSFNLLYLNTADVLLEEADAYDICCEFLPRWFQRICSSHTERFQVSELGDSLFIHIQNAPLVSSICSHGIESSVVANTLSLLECLFLNKTLVQLTLTTYLSFKLPHYLNLPNLRQLSLQLFEFDCQLMRKIFKSLPMLQDLTIFAYLSGDDDHFIDITTPGLKIFTIKFKGRGYQTTVSIDAPKLKHISISISDGLVLFRFAKIPTDLLKTSLSYPSFAGDDVAILELLKAITSTRSLHLSDLCCRILNVLNSYNVDELPTFHNLVHLTLFSDVEDMNVAIPVWILRRVKTIKVQRFIKEYEFDKEMSLVENILSKANVLEQLICVFFRNVEETKMESLKKENDFIKALFMLPRVSSCCEIEFIGRFVRASTDDQKTCVM